jgi:hypothetical protein
MSRLRWFYAIAGGLALAGLAARASFDTESDCGTMTRPLPAMAGATVAVLALAAIVIVEGTRYARARRWAAFAAVVVGGPILIVVAWGAATLMNPDMRTSGCSDSGV